MAGHGGGAWKVAYADFVTAMMAFFLVMWIVAQNKPIKAAIAQYFNDPYGRSSKPGRSDALLPMPAGAGAPAIKSHITAKSKPQSGRGSSEPGNKPADDADQKSRSPGRAGMAAVQINDRVVGTRVIFDDASAELDERGRKALDELLPELLGKSFKIEVRGQASGRPLGPDSKYHDPWELSFARSIATMKYLVAQGVQPRRIRLSQGGPFEPDRSRQSDMGPAASSRVDIYALNELALEPTAPPEEKHGPPTRPDIKAMMRAKGLKTSKDE